MPQANQTFHLSLTGRQLAILGAALSRCLGWDTPQELQRFVNVAAAYVRDGFTEDEMTAVHEKVAEAAIEVG